MDKLAHDLHDLATSTSATTRTDWQSLHCNFWTLDDRTTLSNQVLTATGRFQEYQIIGRHLPSEANPTPKIYRMRVFAPNEVVAKSRFWYFLGKLRKIKKANGEIVSVNQVCWTKSRAM